MSHHPRRNFAAHLVPVPDGETEVRIRVDDGSWVTIEGTDLEVVPDKAGSVMRTAPRRGELEFWFSSLAEVTSRQGPLGDIWRSRAIRARGLCPCGQVCVTGA